MYEKKVPFWQDVRIDFKKHKWKYLLILPVILWMILFEYKSMYGVMIAFKRFRASLGIWESPWVGFEQFRRFFEDAYFGRLLKNTLAISILSLIFSFPAPIILALMMNEVKAKVLKRTVQTVTYMPHFISTVIVCSIIREFFDADGLFPTLMQMVTGEGKSMLLNVKYFRTIYIGSGIWQGVGWGSIIYLAALSGIDQEQYEAARVDGAGRLKQIWHITLPGLLPTVSMLLILNLGGILGVGYEKLLLLYDPMTYEVADVISTYVYRKGMIEADYSFSTAVNLFNNVVNIIVLVSANKFSKKAGQSGLF